MLLACSRTYSQTRNLRTIVEWRDLEYSFPSRADREHAIRERLYVHGNGVPIDVDVDYGDNNFSRIFVTVPRFTTGIPSSLNIISNRSGNDGPKLVPYPSYSWHSSHGSDCEGITSVFRVAIDECNRLWVLDTGRIDTVQHCPPQLLVFNLKSDALVHRYRFPKGHYKPGVSLFVTPIVDVRDPPPYGYCHNTMVYIADVTGFGIVVYDSSINNSWRIHNKYLYPYPEFGTYTIAGESFDLMDGVLGMAISPKNTNSYPSGGGYRPNRPANPGNSDRYLYFHALASAVENRVPLSVLDNRTLWLDSADGNVDQFRIIGKRTTQSAAEAMDSKGNLYFGLVSDISIASWNHNTPYNPSNFKIVAQNTTTLQFASGMKIKRNRVNKEELWALTCRFQKVFSGTKTNREVNFRILGCNTEDLQSSQGCLGIRDRENFIFKS